MKSILTVVTAILENSWLEINDCRKLPKNYQGVLHLLDVNVAPSIGPWGFNQFS